MNGDWTPNRIYAAIIGVAFTLVGIAGFFVAPGMQMGSLMGFHVDLVHNLIHLVTGLAALAAVYTGWARRFNQIFGVVYILVGIAGLIYPALYFNGRLLGLMHVNAADHGLHLVTGLIALVLGYFVHEQRVTSRAKVTV